MGTEFIKDRIWSRLRHRARKCRTPALVAVAFFGEGAAGLLPLRKGSRLLVNASEQTVASGLTCPNDLLELRKRGVRIFSVKNLHAKVYVFGGQAFVGSPNASNNSTRLLEAVLRTTDRQAVRAAKDFVRSHCQDELGTEELKRLKKLYRRPKFDGNGAARRTGKKPGRVKAEYSALRLVNLVLMGDFPEGSESAYEQGLREAKSKRTRKTTHFVDSFQWNNGSIRPGDSVVQVVDELDGPRFVTPPGHVTNVKPWSNGRQRCAFVYLEVPNVRRVRVNKLAKRLGRGAAKRLKRSGLVSSEFAEKLRKAFVR